MKVRFVNKLWNIGFCTNTGGIVLSVSKICSLQTTHLSYWKYELHYFEVLFVIETFFWGGGGGLCIVFTYVQLKYIQIFIGKI